MFSVQTLADDFATANGSYPRPRSEYAMIPPEVLLAKDFITEHQVMARPLACHGDGCGFLTPDTVLPGQDFAVGAAYDLMYGYFMRAAQKLNAPSPIDPDDDDEEDDDDEAMRAT